MDKKRARLLDSAKKLLESDTPREEILKSLSEIGINSDEAKKILEEAQSSYTQKPVSDFGGFSQKPIAKKSFFGGLLGKKTGKSKN